MSDPTKGLAQDRSGSSAGAGRRWLFPMAVLGATIGFVIFVVALSPEIYLPSKRDTPEVWFQRGVAHVDAKEYDKAVEDLERVLRFEPQRKKVFVQAEEKIKNIQQLLKSRGEASSTPAAPAGEAPKEGGTSGEQKAPSAEKAPADETPKTATPPAASPPKEDWMVR